MNHPTELTLENFRCFRTEQRGRLRPITLLVGENSTGKTSFLASYMAIAHCFEQQFMDGEPDFSPNFNIDPFELGSFPDILHAPASMKSSSRRFKLGIGFSDNNPGNDNLDELHVTFGEKNMQPRVHGLRRNFSETEFIEFRRAASGTKVSVPGFSTVLKLPIFEMCRVVERIAIDAALRRTSGKKDQLWRNPFWFQYNEGEGWRQAIECILKFFAPIIHCHFEGKARMSAFDPFRFNDLRQNAKRIVPISPIRSKPKRTYDPLREYPNPEGDHIPMSLLRISESDQRNWDRIRDELIKFGKSANLFSDIRIKNYTKGRVAGPFRLQIKIGSGNFVNIMDVGYGVGQCLPVVAYILMSGISGEGRSSVFLVQHPEAQLHPRAQAALASWICDSAARVGNRFMIETHSDYIVDRIRIMVRKGIVKESDVSIIYFEQESTEDSARLFNLEVDSDGNVVNAPVSYRRFFVAEIDRVLGFSK